MAAVYSPLHTSGSPCLFLQASAMPLLPLTSAATQCCQIQKPPFLIRLVRLTLTDANATAAHVLCATACDEVWSLAFKLCSSLKIICRLIAGQCVGFQLASFWAGMAQANDIFKAACYQQTVTSWEPWVHVYGAQPCLARYG